MRTETESPIDTSRTGTTRATTLPPLPTAPCSVVWSRGHAYVLEPVQGRPRWLGVDDKGRREELRDTDLQRRGWSRTCGR